MDDSYTTPEDTALAIAAPGVTDNDADLVGNSLRASLVSPPSHGTLTLRNDGSFTYTPAANYNGPDSFTYKANDGAADSNVATVAITVTPVNDAPVAAGDSYTTAEDMPLSVAAPGLQANDTDLDGDLVLSVVVVAPQHGMVVLNANGSFTYTPGQDYHGPDSFTYKNNDRKLDSNAATVTIEVTSVEDPPLALDDQYGLNEDLPLTVVAPGVLGNDRDGDDDSLTATQLSSPSHGVLVFSSDGSFQYTPSLNFNGTDKFTYRVSDGHSATLSVATVTLTVAAVNDPPTLRDDKGTTNVNSPMTFTASQLLGNDVGGPVGPAGTVDNEAAQTLTVTGVSSRSAAGGSVLLNAGLITYTPPPNFHGTDTATYDVQDDGLPLPAHATGTLTITVLPINDAAPFQNPVNRFDVNADGDESAIDPLMIINYLNKSGPRSLASSGSGAGLAGGEASPGQTWFPDVTGDNEVTPADVLSVINRLNTKAAGAAGSGEGESASPADSTGTGRSANLGAMRTASTEVQSSGSLLAGAATFVRDLYVPVIVDHRIPEGAIFATNNRLTEPPARSSERSGTGPVANPAASVFDDLDLESLGLEEALSEIAEDGSAAAGEDAADLLFASL